MTNDITLQESLNKVILPEDALELVKKEVDRVLSKSPLMIREYTKHLTMSQGKYIRAVSVITCAIDKEGRVAANAIKIAAAIEILHLATLVHDDIIDNADLRRGEVTLQKKYGKRTAVICGDYLLSMALKMSASIENKKEYFDLNLPDYVGRVCLGELNQHINNHNFNLSIFRYLKIISGKTAALFEASYFAGAIFSGVSEAESKKYKRLGYNLGMIFQLVDDCIDFEETVETAYKPVQSDYEQGVVTLPLIHALQKQKELKDKAESSGLLREEINKAVAESGGIMFTRLLVQRYFDKSAKIIKELEASEDKKDMLMYILKTASKID
ncbi:MAG: Polyprenyl synthetase [Herbinix sp.]|jgi:heptaprenyl diphosphate synthase|nr:Polyprenyl synthetase [Herbinix sp.]